MDEPRNGDDLPHAKRQRRKEVGGREDVMIAEDGRNVRFTPLVPLRCHPITHSRPIPGVFAPLREPFPFRIFG
jgi:hypothetical protein